MMIPELSVIHVNFHLRYHHILVRLYTVNYLPRIDIVRIKLTAWLSPFLRFILIQLCFSLCAYIQRLFWKLIGHRKDIIIMTVELEFIWLLRAALVSKAFFVDPFEKYLSWNSSHFYLLWQNDENLGSIWKNQQSKLEWKFNWNCR